MVGRARADTPLGSGNWPLEGTWTNTGGGGPWARLNTLWNEFGGSRSWKESTGRFWVTTCPKVDPNTPMS